MEGVRKETVLSTVCVTHWTLIEGEISETVCAFLFLLITQTQKIFHWAARANQGLIRLGARKECMSCKSHGALHGAVGWGGRGSEGGTGSGRPVFSTQDRSQTNPTPTLWEAPHQEKNPPLLHFKGNSGTYYKRHKARSGGC